MPRTRLALLAPALLFTVGFTTTAQGMDRTTGRKIAPIRTALEPSVRSDDPDNVQVLWDLTHGVYLNYRPSGDYSSAVGLLAGAGFAVSSLQSGVTNIQLSQYDILVVGIGSCERSPYTPAEVAAIRTFVEQGGGLLILGDNPLVWPEHLNPVAQAFQTATGQAVVGAPDVTVFLSPPAVDRVPELFEGVARIQCGGPGQLESASPMREVGLNDELETLVAASRPQRVVITGDINMFDNRRLFSSSDNRQFLLNVFAFLAPTDPALAKPAPRLTSPRAILADLWQHALRSVGVPPYEKRYGPGTAR